jgi:hypothetical protein
LKISELIKTCFAHDLDGKQTDVCVRSIAVNLLKPTMPVVAIEMKASDDLFRMMVTADDAHIFVEGGVFHFNALYAVTNHFPAPRIYFMKMEDLLQVASLGSYLDRRGMKLRPIDGKKFSQLIDDRHYGERYQQWHRRWEANSKTFKGLLDGRIKNTAVEQGMWLSSDGNCLVCGDRTDRMSTATVIGKTGMMIGLQLCQRHEAEAQNHSTLLEFISIKMRVPAPFLSGAKVTLHSDITISMSCDAISNELDCEIEKVEANTITALRKSGFRIILRQDGLTNYAYNIQDPNRLPISRIDSANHHNVEYGPDHLHRNLSKSKKNIVEPSFTYGFAIADLKVIKQLVEEAESKWGNSLKASQ